MKAGVNQIPGMENIQQTDMEKFPRYVHFN